MRSKKSKKRLFRVTLKRVETFYVEEAVEAHSAAEAKLIMETRNDHCEYDGCFGSPDDANTVITAKPIKPADRREWFTKRLIENMRTREPSDWEKEESK